MKFLIKNRSYVKLGFIFIGIGVFGLLLPFWGVFNDLIFLNILAENQPMFQVENQNPVAPNSTAPTEINQAQKNYPESEVVNQIIIEKAGIKIPYYYGKTAKTLLKGGWLFPGTSTPGQNGNAVVFGHRFRYIPNLSATFYSLDKVEVGDQIIVFWDNKKYIYETIETKIIEPTDFSVLEQTKKPTITLITCTPLFSIKQRLVIVGELKSAEN